jgi:iron(III) transport system permease protein
MVQQFFTNPMHILLLACLIVLGYLMLYPLVEIVDTSFSVARGEAKKLKLEVGAFTTFYWKRCFAEQVSETLFYTPFKNSLLVAVCSTICSVVTGSQIAWLVVRSDIPGKKFFNLAILIPYMLPSWCKAKAWNALFRVKSLAGYSGLLESLGLPVPEWLAYGPVAIICVFTMHYYAYSYLLVSGALKSINSELEEMGDITGASRIKILLKITFPLVLPTVLSATILTLSKTMGGYFICDYLGVPAGFKNLSIILKDHISNTKYQNVGYVVAMITIAISSVTLLLNQVCIGKRRSYATIGGKGGRTNPVRLGATRIPLTVALVAFIFLLNIFATSVLFLETFMKYPGTYSLDNLTLHYWISPGDPGFYEGEAGILRNPRFYTALWSTLKITVLTSIFATCIGQLVGYLTSRMRGKFLGNVMELVVFVPYLMPSLAFGAIYLSMFSTPTWFIPSLYGTFLLVILVSVVKNIPFAARTGQSSMMQISTELEEAAQIEGIGFVKRFVKIIMPLAKSGFMSSFMVTFIGVIKELDLILLVATPKDYNLPLLSYQYKNSFMEPYSNAVTIMLFVIVLGTYVIADKFFDIDLTGGMGG